MNLCYKFLQLFTWRIPGLNVLTGLFHLGSSWYKCRLHNQWSGLRIPVIVCGISSTLPIRMVALSKVWFWPLTCRDCRFESCQGHRRLSSLSVVYCDVDGSASDWPLVQNSPAECGASYCDREISIVRRPWHTRGCRAREKEKPSRTVLPNRLRSLSKSVPTQRLRFFHEMRRSMTTQLHYQVECLQSWAKFEYTATYFHNVRSSINLPSRVLRETSCTQD